jgi:hypothetical protein
MFLALPYRLFFFGSYCALPHTLLLLGMCVINIRCVHVCIGGTR